MESHLNGDGAMSERQNYGKILDELEELAGTRLTQEEKAKTVGTNPTRVSQLGKILREGSDELIELARENLLTGDALKYLPLPDYKPYEDEADWVTSYREATEEERKSMVRKLKGMKTGIVPPTGRQLMIALSRTWTENEGSNRNHLLGIVSGVALGLGYFSLKVAMDRSGARQLEACERLCEGPKAGNFLWIRNIFAAAALEFDT